MLYVSSSGATADGHGQRRGGLLRRATSEEPYLDPLRPLGHALRPLRLVVDTICQPFVGYLCQLTAHAACDIRLLATSTSHSADDGRPVDERRIARLSQHVADHQAHFGVWVSGDGEACRLINEQGILVDDERLCMTLAAYVRREKPDATLVLHEDAGPDLQRSLIARGARVVRSPARREAMFSNMEASGAEFGCGAGGQFWFAGAPAAPDALLVLCLLLRVFSQSDQAVSEVLVQAM
jgi:phosphomannomutase